jgi:hypothetical protein
MQIGFAMMTAEKMQVYRSPKVDVGENKER